LVGGCCPPEPAKADKDLSLWDSPRISAAAASPRTRFPPRQVSDCRAGHPKNNGVLEAQRVTAITATEAEARQTVWAVDTETSPVPVAAEAGRFESFPTRRACPTMQGNKRKTVLGVRNESGGSAWTCRPPCSRAPTR